MALALSLTLITSMTGAVVASPSASPSNSPNDRDRYQRITILIKRETNPAWDPPEWSGWWRRWRNEPPTATISEPAEGAVVSELVTISGTASDSDGTVESVEVYAAGELLEKFSYTDMGDVEWSAEWDTTTVYDGDYTIEAVATDDDGATGEDSITVTVNNGIEPEVPEYYELLGVAWDLSKFSDGVPYVINPTGAPEGAVQAIVQAAENWDLAVVPELYNDDYKIDETAKPSTSRWRGPDFVNTFTWRRIQNRNVIAQATIWYDTQSLLGTAMNADGTTVNIYEIVDVDIVFSTRFDWGIDPDGEGGVTISEMDVQNIATHEIGHMTGLGDLYDDIHSELTMYGYADYGEVKKISLEPGDIAGAQAVY